MKSKRDVVKTIDNILTHRLTTILLLAIITAVFYSSYSAIFDKKLNLGGDNIHYFSGAKAIANGEGYTNTMSFEPTPQTHFPPGYSVFIAALQFISPDDIIFVKEANGVLLWLSLLLLFFLVKKITGNTLVAFCTALFTGIQNSILSFATIMMSEMLFIFISLTALHLAIYLNEKRIRKKGAWKIIAMFTLLLLNVAYIYFVRSVGISMILALVFWFGLLAVQSFLIYRKEKNKTETADLQTSRSWLWQRMVICVLVVVSLLATHTLWGIRQKNAGRIGSSYEGVFMSKTEGQKMTNWDDWKTRVKYNIKMNITVLIPAVLFGTQYDIKATVTKAQWLKGILMVIVFVLGLCYLKRKSFWLIFAYLAISMAVLMLFPEQYQGPRYLIPLIPFFIFLLFNGIVNIVGIVCRLLPQKPKVLVPQVMALVICIFLLYPDYIKAQEGLRLTAKMKTWDKINDPKMNNYLAACKFCKESLPDSSRMITRKPEIYYMFSGYKKAASFPLYATPDTIISYLKRRQATHVILDDWFRHAYVTLYPAIQAHPDKFKVLKEIGKLDEATHQNPTYVLEFNDEWGYHGMWTDGKKTGEGYELYQNGQKYAGYFENNLPNGFGTLYNESGKMIFKGQWKNGIAVRGEGELTYQDGQIYFGEFNNRIPHGQGTLYDSSGKIIHKGQWI
ncbi:MAG: hypothetical protein LBU62_07250, partial [Bacteroidales bacterium]|nr:hypothetical protein [Bacteroidales bacterium]